MTQYLDETNALPEYMPYPKFLLKMELTPTAKLVYVLLLDRFTLSKKNGWKDEDGRVYLVYTIENLAQDCGMCDSAAKRALNELEEAGMIRRIRKGFHTPYRIYIMVPEDTKMVGRKEKNQENRIAGCENNWKDWLGMHESAIRTEAAETPVTEVESTPVEIAETSVTEVENTSVEVTKTPLTGMPGTTSHSAPDTSHRDTEAPPNNIILNHVISNHINTANERAWGEFGNVMLTEAEYTELSNAYPDTFLTMLDFLSARIRDNQIPDEPHAVLLRRILE